ncbi:MAG TPA: Nre family DNA repair protein [Nitrososphaerales archaeon]|nr:Nre family DNA repair protein [Nitrososphaerales archaeon]
MAYASSRWFDPYGVGGSRPEWRTKLIIERPSAEMCLACRGAKLLCGKSSCPILAKVEGFSRHAEKLFSSNMVSGSSPPGVFVGRFGYPKVYIGPMVPAVFGDTSLLDTPEMWKGKTIQEIVDFRYSLIRGCIRAEVHTASEGSSLIDSLQEIAMSERPADSELYLSKKPSQRITFSENSQPFGPSAPMSRFKIQGNVFVDQRIEKAHSDFDLKASEASFELYRSGVIFSKIEKSFSLGAFGEKKRRKLVPTRWSITALDSNLSLKLIEEIKDYGSIDEFRVFHLENLDNVYIGILTPEKWKYEWIEAWHAGTAWNQFGTRPEMIGDYEGYYGRKSYAKPGGCYYSTRFAVSEYFSRERRQGGAIMLREIHPGYILPVGVWNVRESIRSLLHQRYHPFPSMEEALNFACRFFTIPKSFWIANSELLRQEREQMKLTKYFPTI